MLNWPVGAAASWGPDFDQLLAFIAGVSPASQRAASLIAYVPVAIDIASVLACMALAWRLSNPRARASSALGAGAVSTFLPISVYFFARWSDQSLRLRGLGASVEVLLFVVSRNQVHARRALWRWELCGAALFATCMQLYTGTVLIAALAASALALGRARVRAGAPFLGSGAPAYLRPVVRSDRARARSGVVVFSGLIIRLALAMPALTHAVADGVRDPLFKEDRWMARIAESQPLFLRGSISIACEAAATLASPWRADHVGGRSRRPLSREAPGTSRRDRSVHIGAYGSRGHRNVHSR